MADTEKSKLLPLAKLLPQNRQTLCSKVARNELTEKDAK